MAKPAKKSGERSILRYPHIQTIILDFIREFGREEIVTVDFDGNKTSLACFDGVVSSPIYYGYKRRDPRFAELVENAKEDYARTPGNIIPKEIVKEIQQNLIEAMRKESKQGYIKVRSRKRKDAHGNITSTSEEVEVSPPRDYLIKKFLAPEWWTDE